MQHPDQFHIAIIETENPSTPPQWSACLVTGCPCKDARIVSRRRAAFFAAIARTAGQTADRVVPVDPSWAFTWVVPAASASHRALAA